jgi:cytochrome c oxidase assembly factor CtaG
MILQTVSVLAHGDAVPPAPSWSGVVTSWEPAWPITVPLILVAAVYLVAVVVVNRRHPHNRWPLVRSGSFLLGLFLVAFATQGEIAVYDDVLFSMHMAQHLLLIMVAPPLLVYGRPITLALHATRNPWHSRIKTFIRSRPVGALTSAPIATAIYVAVVVGTHLTGFMNLVLAHPLVHDSEHVLYLISGYLFFLPIVGSEPLRHRPSLGLRYALLVLTMPVDTFVGVVLMMSPRGLFPAYAETGRTWGTSPLGDLHTGGATMWIGGDGVMVALILVLTIGLIRRGDTQALLGTWVEGARTRTMHEHITRGGITAPRSRGATVDDDAHLAAYNAYLATLDGRECS